MFEIGFWELVIVMIVALWALGPKHLPILARLVGRWLARMKQSYLALRAEFLE